MYVCISEGGYEGRGKEYEETKEGRKGEGIGRENLKGKKE